MGEHNERDDGAEAACQHGAAAGGLVGGQGGGQRNGGDAGHNEGRMARAQAGTKRPARSGSNAGARKGPSPHAASAAAGTRKSSALPPRSRAREFALQGLYQHLVGGNDVASIDAFTRQLQGFEKADTAHYDALLHGCIELAADLDALIVPLLDRELRLISPIERGCLWIGAYELQRCPDVPWRVVLNEATQLGKDFGGADGHKYVNAVLNRLAPGVRPQEVAADRSPPEAEA